MTEPGPKPNCLGQDRTPRTRKVGHPGAALGFGNDRTPMRPTWLAEAASSASLLRRAQPHGLDIRGPTRLACGSAWRVDLHRTSSHGLKSPFADSQARIPSHREIGGDRSLPGRIGTGATHTHHPHETCPVLSPSCSWQSCGPVILAASSNVLAGDAFGRNSNTAILHPSSALDHSQCAVLSLRCARAAPRQSFVRRFVLAQHPMEIHHQLAMRCSLSPASP